MDSFNKWIEQYKPASKSDLIGNEREIERIVAWLENYDSQRQKFYLEYKRKAEKSNKKKGGKKKEAKLVEAVDTEGISDGIADAAVSGETCIDVEGGGEEVDVADYDIPVTKSKMCSSMLVLGNHGCGKTIAVKTILSSLGYDIEFINANNAASNKNINDRIGKIMKGVDIFDSFDGKMRKDKKVLVIDELDIISNVADKKFVETISKTNDDNWFFPIIFISSMKHAKLLTTLKNATVCVKLNKPTIVDMEQLLFKVAEKEKFTFENQNTIMKIRDHAQFDFRRLMVILYDLRRCFPSKALDEKDVDIYFQTSKTKDTDVEIREATANLMLKYNGIDECLRVYSAEKVILPLMIHQNYPKCLTTYGKKDDLDLATELAESIATSSVIENYIYSEQNWDMQDVHCFYSCILPSFHLTNAGLKTTPEYLKGHLDFPYDLNRTSIRKINKRNVTNANVFLKNLDIIDFMFANTLTKHLIDDKKIDECAKIYKDYDAKTETITSILKINKIDTDKSQPTNIKRLFNGKLA